MTVFDYLEQFTKQYVQDANVSSIDDLSVIVKLNSMYRRIELKQLDTIYKKAYAFPKIENILIEYLEQLNSEYRDYFIIKTMDNTIVYEENQFEKTAYFDYDEDNDKYIIYIPLNGTLRDIFTIIHELIHNKNFNAKKYSLTRTFFTEFLSLLAELLLEDYLKEKKIKDYKIHNNADLYYFQLISLEVDFNIKLIDSYLASGYLDEKIIRQILYNYNQSELNYIQLVIKKMLEKK